MGRVHAPCARGARHLRRGRRHLTSKTPCRGDECVVRGTPSGSEAPRPAFMCTTERRQFCRWVEVERLRPPAHNPPSHPPEDLPNSPVLPMLFIFFRMLLFLVFFSFVFFACPPSTASVHLHGFTGVRVSLVRVERCMCNERAFEKGGKRNGRTAERYGQ